MVKKHFVPKRYWLLIGIFLSALIIRLWQIDAVPAGITHDELDYYLGGKFLGLSGSDFTGTWKWWSLSPMNKETITAELTPLFFVPAAVFFPSSLLAAKLTPAFFGALMSLVMYWFLVIISKGNRRLGLLGAGLMAINPWSVIYSRTAYEVTISLFWYFLSITLFLSTNLTHDKKSHTITRLILSCSALFIGYFTYHGFKFLAPFISVVGIVDYYLVRSHLRDTLKKYWWYFAIPLVLSICLLLFSLLRSEAYGGRTDEVSFMHIDDYAQVVNTDRRLSLSSPITILLQNKYSLFGKDVLSTYFDTFSFSRLFLMAKDGYTLDFPGHGYFYFIEVLFIFMGLLQILRRKSYWVCLLLILISPIPSVVHIGASYALRSQLLIVPLVALAAIGINYIFNHHSIRTVLVVAGLYLISFTYFTYVYFFQNGIRSADQYMLSFRLASSYITHTPNDVPYMVLTRSPQSFFRTHFFYSNQINRSNVHLLQPLFTQGMYSNYEYSNVKVTNKCDLLDYSGKQPLMIEMQYLPTCFQENEMGGRTSWNLLSNPNFQSIGSPLDSREYYRIYNPPICTDTPLPSYVYITNLKQLSVTSLSTDSFCKTWLFNPNKVNP